MLALIEENARQSAVTEDFDEKYKGISEQINVLKRKKLELVREQKMVVNFQRRLDDMDNCLKKTTYEVRDFCQEAPAEHQGRQGRSDRNSTQIRNRDGPKGFIF